MLEAPTPDVDDPTAGLRQLMASTYTTLLAHSDLVPLYLSRQGAHGPNARHLGEVTRGLLRRADVPEPTASDALQVLIVYTIGFAAFTSRLPSAGGTAHQPTTAEMSDNFNRGLGWLLSGVRHSGSALGDGPSA